MTVTKNTKKYIENALNDKMAIELAPLNKKYKELSDYEQQIKTAVFGAINQLIQDEGASRNVTLSYSNGYLSCPTLADERKAIDKEISAIRAKYDRLLVEIIAKCELGGVDKLGLDTMLAEIK